jgi:hypothetical protein
VPTPVLLADVLSGVRIGEERRNVLTGGRQSLARWEYRVNRIFLSRVFLYFFFGLLRFFCRFTPPFRCPFVQPWLLLLPLSTNSCTLAPPAPIPLVVTFLCALWIGKATSSVFLPSPFPRKSFSIGDGT